MVRAWARKRDRELIGSSRHVTDKGVAHGGGHARVRCPSGKSQAFQPEAEFVLIGPQIFTERFEVKKIGEYISIYRFILSIFENSICGYLGMKSFPCMTDQSFIIST